MHRDGGCTEGAISAPFPKNRPASNPLERRTLELPFPISGKAFKIIFKAALERKS